MVGDMFKMRNSSFSEYQLIAVVGLKVFSAFSQGHGPTTSCLNTPLKFLNAEFQRIERRD